MDENLIGDEQVLFRSKISNSVYALGIAMALLAVLSVLWFLISVSSGSEVGGGHICLLLLAPALFTLSGIFILEGFVLARTTEIAVTTRRVVGKTGVLSRKTIDVQHGRVESVQFDQSLCARLFGAGAIVITGSGGTSVRFKGIDAPSAFRKAALEAVDQNKGS